MSKRTELRKVRSLENINNQQAQRPVEQPVQMTQHSTQQRRHQSIHNQNMIVDNQRNIIQNLRRQLSTY